MDISEFLLEKIDTLRFPQVHSQMKRAIYHDPCHLKYGLGITKEPREIIKKIGIDLVPVEGERCCGFAGLFCLSYQDLSRGLLKNCIKDYAGSNAEMIITSCPGCMMQLSQKIKDKPVLHLIETVEEALFHQQ
jgi:glycolate oxidase iron-sulfur subunit